MADKRTQMLMWAMLTLTALHLNIVTLGVQASDADVDEEQLMGWINSDGESTLADDNGSDGPSTAEAITVLNAVVTEANQLARSVGDGGMRDCALGISHLAETVKGSVKEIDESTATSTPVIIGEVGNWMREAAEVQYQCSVCFGVEPAFAPAPAPGPGPAQSDPAPGSSSSEVAYNAEDALKTAFNSAVAAVYSLLKSYRIPGGYRMLSELQF